MRFDRSKAGAKCSSCPLRDKPRVWGEGPNEESISLAILGEAPGEQESIKRKPFCGPSGGLLNSGLSQAGIERFRCWVTNVISCQPTSNNISSFEAIEAKACCSQGFHAELDWLQKDRKLKVLLALGNTAMDSLELPAAISRYRGSVFAYDPVTLPKHEGLIVLPSYHPSYLLRGLQKEIPTWIADLTKAKELSKNAYRPPSERFNLKPTLGDLESFVQTALKKDLLIGVDIETIGLRADRASLMVVGLASSAEDAISVPFFSKGMVPYWDNHDLPLAKALLGKLLAEGRLMFQNALFDISHLRQRGFVVRNPEHDVLLAHHAVHPELPHNLGYIVSIYGKTPYWKDDMKFREDRITEVEDDMLRTYNLRDAVVLHQVLPGLLEDLEEMGTLKIYTNISMKLVPVLLDMSSRGISIDPDRLSAWRKSLERKAAKLEKSIRSEFSLPSAFNLDSGDHLRYMLFGEQPAQFDRAQSELAEYDNPARKRPLRKDTEKYRNLLGIVSVSKTRVLRTLGKKRRTDSGKASTDDEALLSLRMSINERISDISNFVLRKEVHRTEAVELTRTLSFLDQLSSYREVSKLKSTYSDFPRWPDGSVHTSFMVHGTATGRLSSREPNLQNIPKEVRSLFVARDGYVFLEADYSNLEPRILAYVSNDLENIETFESGKNIHDANTVALFPEMTKTHPLWKDARMAAKKYRLAMNYGGGLYAVYRKVYMEAPKLKLTFEAFKEADANYQSRHKAEQLWLQKTGDLAVSKRELKNIFGRIRIFLGTEDEVRREGVNFPIQSTAADIINPAMIELHEKARSFGSHLLLQVHDSLLFEVPKNQLKSFAKMVSEVMSSKVKIGRRLVSFPVEISIGSSWGEMKAF